MQNLLCCQYDNECHQNYQALIKSGSCNASQHSLLGELTQG